VSNQVATIQADVYSVQPQFERVAGHGLKFDAEAQFAMQAITASDYALGIAMSNRQSVINAVSNIAAIGLSLNPAKKQAYLVPRDGRICLDISYMGLLDLAISAGSVRWGQCKLVHQADTFELEGLDKQPSHRYQPFDKDRGPVVGVYCTVKTSDGDYLTHAMSIEDVHAIRDRSSAWKAWVSKKKSCPWVTDEGEMVKKTCVKQACKYWPRVETSKLETAIHYLNTEAGEGLHVEDDKPKSRPSGGKQAGQDALAEMSTEDQQVMRELAAEAVEAFKEYGIAPAFDFIKTQALDVDQAVAFWSLLPSDMRSALKAEKKARDEAVKVVT
jgi:recombination protein RecT